MQNGLPFTLAGLDHQGEQDVSTKNSYDPYESILTTHNNKQLHCTWTRAEKYSVAVAPSGLCRTSTTYNVLSTMEPVYL